MRIAWIDFRWDFGGRSSFCQFLIIPWKHHLRLLDWRGFPEGRWFRWSRIPDRWLRSQDCDLALMWICWGLNPHDMVARDALPSRNTTVRPCWWSNYASDWGMKKRGFLILVPRCWDRKQRSQGFCGMLCEVTEQGNALLASESDRFELQSHDSRPDLCLD